MRVLLVGLGNRGRLWARVIGGALAGTVDTDPARGADFTDLEDALARTRADAVVLATPPEGHLAQAGLVIGAGLALLCEKPLALDLAEAHAIVTLAERAGTPLSVGLNFRYLPVSQEMRRLIAAEAFGPPGFGNFAYRRNRDWWRTGMNRYPLLMRHPMMLEQTIHHLDLIRFCYGREALSVSCRSWNPAWSVYADEANVSCLLSMEGGLEVDYTGTWTGGWNQLAFEWRTDCPDGIIVQRGLFADLATAGRDDETLTPVPLPACEPFLDDTRALFAAFVAAVESGQPPPCAGRDHLQSLTLCFAAIEADRTGTRVELARFAAAHGLDR